MINLFKLMIGLMKRTKVIVQVKGAFREGLRRQAKAIIATKKRLKATKRPIAALQKHSKATRKWERTEREFLKGKNMDAIWWRHCVWCNRRASKRRFHHTARPNRIRLSATVPPEDREDLTVNSPRSLSLLFCPVLACNHYNLRCVPD